MMMSMPLIVNCTQSLAVGCGNILVTKNALKKMVFLKKTGNRGCMAVTGDETETGMFFFNLLLELIFFCSLKIFIMQNIVRAKSELMGTFTVTDSEAL